MPEPVGAKGKKEANTVELISMYSEGDFLRLVDGRPDRGRPSAVETRTSFHRCYMRPTVLSRWKRMNEVLFQHREQLMPCAYGISVG